MLEALRGGQARWAWLGLLLRTRPGRAQIAMVEVPFVIFMSAIQGSVSTPSDTAYPVGPRFRSPLST